MGFLVLQVGVNGLDQGSKGRLKIILCLKRDPLVLAQFGVHVGLGKIFAPQHGDEAFAVGNRVVNLLTAVV